MREILFRGKQSENKEWIYGSLIKRNIGCFIVDENDKCALRSAAEFDFSFDCKLVKPETIGQYTGLTDKNGKKIFEGDIVKYSIGTFVVKFLCGTFCCSLIEDNYLTDVCSIHNQCEVIGNIHDNPELLKECEG